MGEARASGVLREDTIYLGDNGRAFCGKSRCAGATAFYSGRDLSGQPVAPITAPDDIRAAVVAGLTCEGCGMGADLRGKRGLR